jgi:hypothetical protein
MHRLVALQASHLQYLNSSRNENLPVRCPRYCPAFYCCPGRSGCRIPPSASFINQNYGFERDHRLTREERRRWEAGHNYGYAQGYRVSPQERARWEDRYRH